MTGPSRGSPLDSETIRDLINRVQELEDRVADLTTRSSKTDENTQREPDNITIIVDENGELGILGGRADSTKKGMPFQRKIDGKFGFDWVRLVRDTC
jgi:hypothetical protein